MMIRQSAKHLVNRDVTTVPPIIPTSSLSGPLSRPLEDALEEFIDRLGASVGSRVLNM